MKQCLICGSPCREKYCKEHAKEQYNARRKQWHKERQRANTKRFIGCDEDCFNCLYPDCRKPAASFKADKDAKKSRAVVTSESSSRMYTLELGGYGGPRPNISRKFYV